MKIYKDKQVVGTLSSDMSLQTTDATLKSTFSTWKSKGIPVLSGTGAVGAVLKDNLDFVKPSIAVIGLIKMQLRDLGYEVST